MMDVCIVYIACDGVYGVWMCVCEGGNGEMEGDVFTFLLI